MKRAEYTMYVITVNLWRDRVNVPFQCTLLFRDGKALRQNVPSSYGQRRLSAAA